MPEGSSLCQETPLSFSLLLHILTDSCPLYLENHLLDSLCILQWIFNQKSKCLSLIQPFVELSNELISF
jgi:hypothetical protein